jgi:hypothetical protein
MCEDLEQIPEGIDPLLDEAADEMVGGIHDAVENVERFPDEPVDDYVRRRNEAADQAVLHGAGGAWNTLPQGKPGSCRDRLIVTVHEDKDVIPRLIEALWHAERICPQTRLVMFVLMAPHLSWRAAWPAFRQDFSRRCPQVALRVEAIGHPRPSRGWWYDRAFKGHCNPGQAQLYAHLLQEIRTVSEEQMGLEVGLCVAYTNTNTRDLRVRGNFDGFQVLMRFITRGDGFKVYVLLDPNRPEIQNLAPYHEPHGRLSVSLQCGGPHGHQPGCSAQRIGEILRLALASAPR